MRRDGGQRLGEGHRPPRRYEHVRQLVEVAGAAQQGRRGERRLGPLGADQHAHVPHPGGQGPGQLSVAGLGPVGSHPVGGGVLALAQPGQLDGECRALLVQSLVRDGLGQHEPGEGVRQVGDRVVEGAAAFAREGALVVAQAQGVVEPGQGIQNGSRSSRATVSPAGTSRAVEPGG
ncbi:hypothetical protein ACFSNO_07130 [Streptomyces cirratus]